MERKRGSPPRGRDRFPGRDMVPAGRDPRGGDPFKGDYGPSSGRRRSPSPLYDRYDRRPRGSPPPPIKRHRRDDMPYDRYMRDASPSYRRHSPPPHRGGYDEREYYDIDHRRGPPPPPPGGPPSRRHGEEDMGPGRMMSFKEFILEQPDDPSVEESQARYKQYMIEYHGGEIKAEFAAKKDDEELRAMFDPRMFEKVLVQRNEEAKASATQFAADMEAGKLDPKAEGFNQGMFALAQLPKKPASAGEPGGDGHADAAAGAAAPGQDGNKPLAEGDKAGASAPEEPEGGDQPVFTPSMCWRPERVATDLRLAAKLIRKLDEEKEIEGNTLLPPLPTPPEAKEPPSEGDAPPKGAEDSADPAPADGDAPAAAADGDADAATAAPAEGGDTAAACKPGERENDPDAVSVDSTNLAEMTGRLDLLLTYLWCVHGIDYYAGYELQAAEFQQRQLACRLLRGLRPEELNIGDSPEAIEAAEADEKHDAELVSKTVDETWMRRMEEGDPLEGRCQRKRIETAVDEWVESQIIAFQDNKWGNKLSTKLFVGKKFVLKHIRVKHEDKVQAERDRICDEVYFENFKEFKEEEAAAAQAAPDAVVDAAALPVEEAAPGEGFVEGMEGGGHMRGGGRMGGRMVRGGRMPPVRGGRYGGRMGMPMGMMEMGGGMPVAPGMGMMGMGGMGMGGAMFIPAPGAGPMGPFLPILPAAGAVAPMMMGPMGGRRGGGRMGPRGGGRMWGGRFGGRMEGGPMREYFDLDNPQNNRAVLDYGDL